MEIKGKQVLVVEDELDLLEEISDMLRFEGFDVLKASSGEDGVSIARENHPDIILCDIVLPGITGFDVIDQLKRDDQFAMVPFVFITARTERVSHRLGMDMGADDFIIKPFTRSELINSVKARLEKVKAVESSLNVLKEEVVASLPHEFRTPLNAVLGFSKIIQEDIDKHSSADISEMAGYIFKSGVDLFRLSQKYLIYLEVVVRNKEFFYYDVKDLKGTIETIAREVAADHDRCHDLVMDVSNISMKLTEEYFRFAVRELIDNAFKFSSPGQKVEINAGMQGYDYHLTINDEGIGFPDGAIINIEAFQQFSSGQFSTSGLGLGLFLARKIIGINKGKAEIFSVPEKGTKISVILPGYEIKPETIETESRHQ